MIDHLLILLISALDLSFIFASLVISPFIAVRRYGPLIAVHVSDSQLSQRCAPPTHYALDCRETHGSTKPLAVTRERFSSYGTSPCTKNPQLVRCHRCRRDCVAAMSVYSYFYERFNERPVGQRSQSTTDPDRHFIFGG